MLVNHQNEKTHIFATEGNYKLDQKWSIGGKIGYKKENYSYVQINNNTNIKDIDELKNSIYTFLDAGWDKYIIKCDPAYASCVTDIKKIAKKELIDYQLRFDYWLEREKKEREEDFGRFE